MKTPSRFLLLAALLTTSCGGSDPQAGTNGETPEAPATIAESFWSATAPEGAVDVTALRELEDGAGVVVRGEVREFKLEGMGQFWLADLALMSCADMEMDSCPEPWDFCCEDPDALERGTAIVEFHTDGQLAKGSVQGFHGIDHLTDVVVSGKLQIDDKGNLLVLADKIHAE